MQERKEKRERERRGEMERKKKKKNLEQGESRQETFCNKLNDNIQLIELFSITSSFYLQIGKY